MNRFFTLLLAASCLTAVGQVPEYVPTDGLVGWWPFSGSAQNLANADDSSVVSGAVLGVDRFGNAQHAYVFDGVDDEILTSNLGAAGSGISASYWYKSSQMTGAATLISFGGNGPASAFEVMNNYWSAGTEGPCYGPAFHGNSTLVSKGGSDFPDSTSWHHAVVVLPEGAGSLADVRFYVDGVEWGEICSFASYSGAGIPLVGTDNPVKFGHGYAGSWSNFFEGILDDIGLWNRSLTEAEIQGLFSPPFTAVGCTDPEACNYDPAATMDDGSCFFVPADLLDSEIIACDDSLILMATAGLDTYLWNTGEITQSIVIEESGQYSVSGQVSQPNDDNAHSLSLNGSGAYVELPSSFSIDSEDGMTFGFWLKPNWTADDYILDFKDDGDLRVVFAHFGGQGFFLMVEGGDVPGGSHYAYDNALLSSSDWHYITGVLSNEGQIKLYRDGVVMDVTDIAPGDYNLSTGGLKVVGGETGIPLAGWQFYSGLLDELTIWNRVLGPQELTAVMSCPNLPSMQGVVGQWRFEDITNGLVLDASPNGSHGTVHDIELSSDIPEMECTAQSLCHVSDTVTVVFNHGSCYCGRGTVWDPSQEMCIGDGSGDINLDGCVQLNDLLDLLSAYGDCGAEESPWQCGDPLEYQGYDYETVQIGEQCWFAENLKKLDFVFPGNDDKSISEPRAYVQGYNGYEVEEAILSDNFHEYGALYNYPAVLNESLCPSGWSPGTDQDWIDLVVSLGIDSVEANTYTCCDGEEYRGDVADLLKDESWQGGINTSGFSALPAGFVRANGGGSFDHLGTNGYFWTTSEAVEEYLSQGMLEETAMIHYLFSGVSGVGRIVTNRAQAFSVRCLKDSE